MDLVSGVAAVIVTALILWVAIVALLWLHRPSRELALPAVRMLPDVLRLIRRLIVDPTTPRSVKVALAFLALWIGSPIDLIPEFLPGIGPVDDIVAAAVILGWAGRRVGRDRLEAAWSGGPESFEVLTRLLRLPSA